MDQRPLSRRLERWLDETATRVAGDLSARELHRGLRALSETYVARRAGVERGAALRGTGKRAAFALYYAPLHLLTVRTIVDRLGAERPAPRELLDLGCGTGAAGAGWALACARRPQLQGIDLNPWALDEARRTWRALGLRGRVRRGRIEGLESATRVDGIVLGWSVNELDADARELLLEQLLGAPRRGAALLVLEPIWRRDAAWWDRWAARFAEEGGRADEWRLEPELPDRLRELGRAAGLDPGAIGARSLWRPSGRAG